MKLLFVAMQRNGMTITSSKLQKEKYKPQKKKKQQKKGQIARYYSLSIKDTISFIYRKGKLCDNMLQPLYYGIEKQKEKSFIPYRLGFKYYISRFLLMGLKKNIFKTFPNIFFVFRNKSRKILPTSFNSSRQVVAYSFKNNAVNNFRKEKS